MSQSSFTTMSFKCPCEYNFVLTASLSHIISNTLRLPGMLSFKRHFVREMANPNISHIYQNDRNDCEEECEPGKDTEQSHCQRLLVSKHASVDKEKDIQNNLELYLKSTCLSCKALIAASVNRVFVFPVNNSRI